MLFAVTLLCVFGLRRTFLHARFDLSGPLGLPRGVLAKRSFDASSAAFACVAGIGGWLLGSLLMGTVVFAIVIATFSPIQRWALQWKTRNQFRVVLPIFVEEFARCLRGGLTPSQALIDASNVSGPPFPEAFGAVAALLQAGASAEEAVTSWAKTRNDSSLHFLATAVAVGSAVGGIDGRSADAVAVALRERSTVEAVVRVQATQALCSAGVLCGAPVLFCVLVVFTDPRSSSFLLTNPVGMGLGVLGLFLDTAGALWMRRLVKRVSQ